MSILELAVIGAGNVGRAIAADIIQTRDDLNVRVFDVHPAALALAQQIHESRIKVAQLNADDSEAVARAIEGCAVVVNTTDGTQCVSILDGAIKAGIHYTDVHGVFLYERLERRAAIEAAGITAMLGMGFSPGVANMLAGYGARRFSGSKSIDIEYVTHRPLNSSHGLLETALRQFYEHVRSPYYEKGELKELPPFSGSKITRFPTLDEDVEVVCTPHSEPRTIPMYLSDLDRVSVRGTYDPKVMRLIRTLYDFGLLNDDIRVGADGGTLPFRPLLRQALMGDGRLKPDGLMPLYIMRVSVSGKEGGMHKCVEFVMGNPDGWDPLPQGRMTALPTSFAAQLIATNVFSERGITGPEMMSDAHSADCIDYLRERGLWYEEATTLSDH